MANIEKILTKMFDLHTKGVDSYVNNGSLWLIFTEKKQWVIELDISGTLWYNYSFFSKIFKLISMDVVKNQHYITRWVEDTLQNGVKDTSEYTSEPSTSVEDTLQNGVKRAKRFESVQRKSVEDTLQNGVKRTTSCQLEYLHIVEDTLQNGVKRTSRELLQPLFAVEDAIQNGVKHTSCFQNNCSPLVEDTLQNGVKKK